MGLGVYSASRGSLSQVISLVAACWLVSLFTLLWIVALRNRCHSSRSCVARFSIQSIVSGLLRSGRDILFLGTVALTERAMSGVASLVVCWALGSWCTFSTLSCLLVWSLGLAEST